MYKKVFLPYRTDLVPASACATHVVGGPARVAAVLVARLRLLPAVVARRRRVLVVVVASHVADHLALAAQLARA